MAKKKKEEVVEEPQTQAVETVVEEPKPKRKEPKKTIINGWEIKPRVYILNKGMSPVTYTIKSRDLLYFDEEKGYERLITYASNQTTPFNDEFKGQVRLEHIVFRDGSLYVPKEKVALQKFLSLYHPYRGKVYFEKNETQQKEQHADYLEYELMAMNAANSMEIDILEAIMRVEIGSGVSNMTSKELKRDALMFARRNPQAFLELANDDNIYLRNVGIKAVEAKIIGLSQDQRTFSWVSNNRKLMTVPFDEHPYSALASWFKTDEGMEIFKTIEKRLG
tara:strand:+ start:5734 stop:6567 length:834 start_codon:yes stop_codon:yes gene_type:complete